MQNKNELSRLAWKNFMKEHKFGKLIKKKKIRPKRKRNYTLENQFKDLQGNNLWVKYNRCDTELLMRNISKHLTLCGRKNPALTQRGGNRMFQGGDGGNDSNERVNVDVNDEDNRVNNNNIEGGDDGDGDGDDGDQGVTKFFASYEQKSSTCPFLQDTRMITAS